MGKRSKENPQSEWAAYADYEDELEEARIKERDELLTRQEEHELKMLRMKLDSIDKLSDAISSLSLSMMAAVTKQQNSPVINLCINADSNPETLQNTILQIKDAFSK